VQSKALCCKTAEAFASAHWIIFSGAKEKPSATCLLVSFSSSAAFIRINIYSTCGTLHQNIFVKNITHITKNNRILVFNAKLKHEHN
jgi:hypothetical protein